MGLFFSNFTSFRVDVIGKKKNLYTTSHHVDNRKIVILTLELQSWTVCFPVACGFRKCL